MKALKAISRKGSNVIVVLHQPSYQLYEMFDHVMLLSKGGKTAFTGEASHALTYFQSLGFTCPDLMNPAGNFE